MVYQLSYEDPRVESRPIYPVHLYPRYRNQWDIKWSPSVTVFCYKSVSLSLKELNNIKNIPVLKHELLRKKNHLFQEHNKITLLRVRPRTSYFTTTSSTFVELQSATAVCVTKKCHNVHVSDSWLLYNFESLIINHSKYSTYHLKNFLWQRLLAIPHHAVYKFTRFWSKTDTDSNYIVY